MHLPAKHLLWQAAFLWFWYSVYSLTSGWPQYAPSSFMAFHWLLVKAHIDICSGGNLHSFIPWQGIRIPNMQGVFVWYLSIEVSYLTYSPQLPVIQCMKNQHLVYLDSGSLTSSPSFLRSFVLATFFSSVIICTLYSGLCGMLQFVQGLFLNFVRAWLESLPT